MKPICASDHLEMKKCHSGIYVFEMAVSTQGIYKVWMADAFICVQCSKLIISDFASKPFIQDFDDNCKEKVEELLVKHKKGEVVIVCSHEFRTENGNVINLTKDMWPATQVVKF